LGAWPNLLLWGGLLALVAASLWGQTQPKQFAWSYLVAFIYCFTLCAGSLFWVLLHHVVNAGWSVLARRVAEQVAGLFPYLFLAFAPVWLLREKIYKWWTIPPGTDPLLDAKRSYLDGGAFTCGRTVAYFAFFVGAAWLFRRFSLQQDRSGDPRLSLRMRYIANGGLFLFAVCFTFFVFDYLMALDHHWFSTMWGVYLFAGSAQSSMALLILISNFLWTRGYLKGLMTEEHNHMMGKLLFAFTVFWAYIAFSQYMLIYYANIPEETTFFLTRNAGSWRYYSMFLVVGHFFLPFLALITQPAKRDPRRICAVAGWVLFAHLADIYWIIIPQAQANAVHAGEAVRQGFYPHGLDLLCWAGLVALFGALLLRALSRHPVYPVRDPRLPECIALKN
jgi:hypothetical protein